MRKQIITDHRVPPSQPPEGSWLELDRIASVELTSEAEAHPIEAALTGTGEGWRAGVPGTQILRLRFDAPQRIRRVWLEIEERGTTRTQEMLLAWAPADGTLHELVRQRWNFSPDGSTCEKEDYRFDLENVMCLELTLQPDIERNQAVASLRRLRVA